MNLGWYLFSFEGRIGRRDYWLFELLMFAILALVWIFSNSGILGSPGPSLNGPTILAGLLLLWPHLAVQAKRWHDTDHSAWWMLLQVVPVIGGTWTLVINGFFRGTQGANRFGRAPSSDAQSELENEADVQSPARVARRKTLLKQGLLISILPVTLVLTLRSSIFDWYEVPAGSMLPTIQLGDRIAVNKMAYQLRIPFVMKPLLQIAKPKRGDVVLLLYPEDNHTAYVKRLIGLPGDQIEIRENVLYLNGVPSKREPVGPETLIPERGQDTESTLYQETIDGHSYLVAERMTDSYGPISVPDHMYFVIGDNRDNSADSRTWGFVPEENLLGRAGWVVFSLSPEGFRGNRTFLRLDSRDMN